MLDLNGVNNKSGLFQNLDNKIDNFKNDGDSDQTKKLRKKHVLRY